MAPAPPRRARLTAPLRHPLAAVLVATAAFRLASLAFVTHPGFTDGFYYFGAAQRLARGEGLSIDFVWNFLEAPGLAPLPVASHRFWMPLATFLQAAGIAVLAGPLPTFRAAQAPLVLVALAIPAVAYVAARGLRLGPRAAAVAGLLAGLGGALAPWWSTLDNFALVALCGTALFAALPCLARGSHGAALVSGAALGALLLARADGALFALAPLVVARSRPRALAVALGLAMAIALPWFFRDLVLLGVPEGQLARVAFLVRYEDFFRLAPPEVSAYLGSPGAALAAKAEALVTNAGTFLLVTSVALGPLALWEGWRRRREPLAGGWLLVSAALYLVQSLVFTLHGTRGSYVHSLAGVVPIALALAVAWGAAHLRPATLRVAAGGLVAATIAYSSFALVAWRDAYDPLFATRAAVARSGAIATPALVVDAAAWRAHLDGPTLVLPAEGLTAAREVARRYGARSLVVEPIHFSAYDALYRGGARIEWLEVAVKLEDVTVYRIVAP